MCDHLQLCEAALLTEEECIGGAIPLDVFSHTLNLGLQTSWHQILERKNRARTGRRTEQASSDEGLYNKDRNVKVKMLVVCEVIVLLSTEEYVLK